MRSSFDELNLKVNELLYRRVDIQDAADAHLLALDRAADIGFGRYILSATTPFTRDDLAQLRRDTRDVVRRLYPDFEDIYAARGWTMDASIDRVYVNAHAREELGWSPAYDFRRALTAVAAGEDPRSPLALQIGAKGYHAEPTGVYTTRARELPD
jgi:nucleoside-diphosphate-sugar epimerase